MKTIVAFLFFKNRYQSQSFVVFYIERLFYRLQGALMKRFLTIALAVLLFMLPSCSWNLEDDVTDKVTQDISNIPSDGAFLNEIERNCNYV